MFSPKKCCDHYGLRSFSPSTTSVIFVPGRTEDCWRCSRWRNRYICHVGTSRRSNRSWSSSGSMTERLSTSCMKNGKKATYVVLGPLMKTAESVALSRAKQSMVLFLGRRIQLTPYFAHLRLHRQTEVRLVRDRSRSKFRRRTGERQMHPFLTSITPEGDCRESHSFDACHTTTLCTSFTFPDHEVLIQGTWWWMTVIICRRGTHGNTRA